MTAAYVSSVEMNYERFRDHLMSEGFDVSGWHREQLIQLMFATAAFFDKEYPSSPLCSLLRERVQA